MIRRVAFDLDGVVRPPQPRGELRRGTGAG
jgi:hypothetical protein